MFPDHLAQAGPELREAVEAFGGDQLVAALDHLIADREEYICDWFDARWDDTIAEEIQNWSVARMARTHETVAHLELDLELVTYPAADDDLEGAGITVSPAFARVVLKPEPIVDRFELGFDHLGAWIEHDAVRWQ